MDIHRTFILGTQLTPEQLRFFDEFGFIHFKNFIDRKEIDHLINAIHELELDWIKKGIEKVNGIPIKYGKDELGNPIVQRFAFASLHSEVLHNFLKDERLAALRSFIKKKSRIVEDEKDGMVINHYINNGNSNYTKLGWHTDSLRDIFQGFHKNPMINVGTSLDDSPKEKGSLRVIPGSHKQNTFDMLFKKKHFVDNTPDKNEFIVETEAGDLTVHHGRMWHRVALASVTGAESRRRIIYFPIICGSYKPKSEKSPTPFHHQIQQIVKVVK